MHPKPANDNPADISPDELLYRCVEQLCVVANMAKTLSEMHQFPLSEEGSKTVAMAFEEIHKLTRGMDTKPVLSRLSVNIAAAAQQKHMLGATLSVAKSTGQITMKMHYGPGSNDFSDMLLPPEVAQQLSEGLMQAISMVKPKQQLILPDNKLIQ